MKRILIVEDEKMLADVYQERFKAEGIEALVVYSAKEAFEALQREKPDLILLDILLPQENGLSLLKRLQAGEKGWDVPVIAFSNYDEAKTREEALALGVKDYLIKTDYTPRQVVEKIKKYLS